MDRIGFVNRTCIILVSLASVTRMEDPVDMADAEPA